MNQEELIVLISKGSGSQKGELVYEQKIKPALLSKPHRLVVTKDKNTVKETAESLKDSQGNVTVIFLSGDTVVSEFINNLPFSKGHRNLTIALVPCGTGNALCHSLGISNSQIACEKLLSGTAKPLPLYRVSFGDPVTLVDGSRVSSMVFVVVVSWGLHSLLVAESDSEEMRKFGSERFKMAAEKILEENPKFHGKISLQEEAFTDKPMSYFVVTPAVRFEEKFTISPEGSLLKDELYMVHFDYQESSSDTMEIMYEAYNGGNHVNDPKVNYVLVPSKLKLEIQEQDSTLSRVCVDGSIVCLEGANKTIQVESCGLYNGWSVSVIS